MSTAKFSTWLNPDGTENYKCRAWVNFNGTGTVAIRAAGNVASITDNGTGDYTVNFTTAMPDADYSMNVSSNWQYGGSNTAADIGVFSSSSAIVPPTTTAARFTTKYNPIGTAYDFTYLCVSIHR